MKNSSLIQTGAWALVAVGVCSFLYGVLYTVFVVLAARLDPAASLTSFGIQSTNLILALGGLFSVIANVVIFERVRGAGEAWARLAMWLGILGAILSGLHGWYDLIKNPTLASAYADGGASAAAASVINNLPSAVDPRGVGTFGLAGLSLLILSRVLYHVEGLPRRLADLATLASILLVLIFVGTVAYAGGLGIVPARFLFLIPGPLQSIIVGPVFYIWLGMNLRKSPGTGQS